MLQWRAAILISAVKIGASVYEWLQRFTIPNGLNQLLVRIFRILFHAERAGVRETRDHDTPAKKARFRLKKGLARHPPLPFFTLRTIGYTSNMKHKRSLETTRFPTTLLLGIAAPYNRTASMDAYFAEFESLVETSGTPYTEKLFLSLRDVDPVYFLTKGKLEQVKKICDEHEIQEVILSEALSAQQERNLEDYLDCTVIDRTRLILEIFRRAAHSAEGKTQVAIATLQHEKSRLAGKGIHLHQQAGITGLIGGPGETLKERERRAIEQGITTLRKQLVKVEKARETQRKRRLESHQPLICLIGYTNTGKSTIINALTKSKVEAEDKLFATLDTTTRELYVDGKKKGLISDTVGFIQQLPHQLINAFKSTLSELSYADLLLHVIDLSDPNWRDHIRIVRNILDELGVEKDTLYVFNKRDRITDDESEEMQDALEQYTPRVIISARSKEGIEPLKKFLASWQRPS